MNLQCDDCGIGIENYSQQRTVFYADRVYNKANLCISCFYDRIKNYFENGNEAKKVVKHSGEFIIGGAWD